MKATRKDTYIMEFSSNGLRDLAQDKNIAVYQVEYTREDHRISKQGIETYTEQWSMFLVEWGVKNG